MIIQGKIPGREHPLSIAIEGDRVSRVEPSQGGIFFDAGGPDFYLCRGFFDPQANGFAGVDFNGRDLTPTNLHQAARSLASTGVARFLPTLITASHEKIVAQLIVWLEQEPPRKIHSGKSGSGGESRGSVGQVTRHSLLSRVHLDHGSGCQQCDPVCGT